MVAFNSVDQPISNLDNEKVLGNTNIDLPPIFVVISIFYINFIVFKGEIMTTCQNDTNDNVSDDTNLNNILHSDIILDTSTLAKYT